jgi:hypothetical protein
MKFSSVAVLLSCFFVSTTVPLVSAAAKKSAKKSAKKYAKKHAKKSAKKSAKKYAKKYAKKSAKDDKTGCLGLSELICGEALAEFTLTASQDKDYGPVTLQTGHSGNDCTWRGGELDGTGPNNNCIVRYTSSIPHIKSVWVHDGVGTL